MENIIINEDNLKEYELEEVRSKVRALLIDEFDNVIMVDYGDLYLFPGGSVNKFENLMDAIKRELFEETGENYETYDLEPMACLKYYQKNYPKRDGTNKNRLIITYYFFARSKGIDYQNQQLTQSEISGGFKLKLVNLSSIEELFIKNVTNNPRNKYFKRESIEIIRYYKSLIEKEKVKIK